MKNATIFIIIGLIIATSVLGYLYYQEQQNEIEIKVPGVEIEGN